MTQATTPPPQPARPRGRPALPAGAAKSAYIGYRTSDAHKAMALAKSAAAGLSLPDWMDQLVARAPLTPAASV